MTFALMALAFVAVTNPGRAGAISARAVAFGAALVVLAASVASSLLDWLDISPESFRIAAGIVVGISAARVMLWPRFTGPADAVLLTPDVAYLALSLGADERQWRVFLAAACALPFLAAWRRDPSPLSAQALAAIEMLIAVVLVVHGVRDV